MPANTFAPGGFIMKQSGLVYMVLGITREGRYQIRIVSGQSIVFTVNGDAKPARGARARLLQWRTIPPSVITRAMARFVELSANQVSA